jgi:tetratricopeptide (TPR) repeat protein
VVATGVFVLRRRAARRDRLARDVTVGTLGAALVALLHSAVDFGLRLPGNALLLVAVGALLPAAVALRRGAGGDWVDLPTWRWRPTVPTRLAVGATIGVAFAVIGSLVAPRALADWHLHQADSIVAEARLAQRRLTLPELDRAWSQLERASRLDPRQPAIAAAAGSVAADLASRIWIFGVVVDGHHVARASAAERLAASEPYFAAAIDAYRRSLETRPQSGDVRERYGWLLAGLESVRGVARAEGLRASRPSLASLIETDRSLIPLALQELQEAASRDPFSASRQYGLALFALLHLGPEGHEVAARASRQALALDPSLVDEIVVQLATRSDRLALLPAAVPPRFELWLRVADQLEDRGQLAAAAMARAETVALAADSRQQVQAQLSWSRALLDRGDAVRALGHAQRALVLAPTDPDALIAVADAQQASSQSDEAEATLIGAIRLTEVSPGGQERAIRLQTRLARLLTDRGQHARALSAWREVLRATPNDANAHFQVGALLETLNEWTSALWEYRLAEEFGRRDAGLIAAIAQSYARRGLLREAADAYRRAIVLQSAETPQLEAELRAIVARMEAPTQAAPAER